MQAFDIAPPLVVAEIDEPIGQSTDRGLGAERRETITARWAVEQADAMENGEQNRLIGEPFLFIRSITRRA